MKAQSSRMKSVLDIIDKVGRCLSLIDVDQRPEGKPANFGWRRKHHVWNRKNSNCKKTSALVVFRSAAVAEKVKNNVRFTTLASPDLDDEI